MYDICVIGGGASGMTAAITAKMNAPQLNVVILEKNQSLGQKLLATGNGRCNITNEACENFREALAFFEKIGVLAKLEDGGRFYPYSEEAKEVVKAMVFQIESLGIEYRTDFQVKEIRRAKGTSKAPCFTVLGQAGNEGKASSKTARTGEEIIEAKKLLIATGGKAGPQFGTIGDGYKWAKAFGHRVTKLVPALAPIECEGDFGNFKGIRQDVRLSLYRAEAGQSLLTEPGQLPLEAEPVFQEEGNLQMTADGLSGIVTFNLSRYLTVEDGENVQDGLKRYVIGVDFMPEMEEDQVVELLTDRKVMKGAEGRHLFMSLLKEPLVFDIFKRTGIDPFEPADAISQKDIEALAKVTKNWLCQVKGVKGWKQAQVTKGGIPLDEIDIETMESKLEKGLYFVGEIIDYDGPCGGFNLQNAWETGIKAGEHLAGI